MHVLLRGSAAQRLRLLSGLILFVFAATHFINHGLGLVSLDAMNGFDAARVAVIRSVPGTVVLVGAVLAHVALATATLFGRRTLKMPVWQAWQVGLGLIIPILLVPHIVNTRVTDHRFGVHTTYPYELLRIWPASIDLQTVLMAVVWLHGCIGIHYWLRVANWYGRVSPVLLSVAVLIPFAAFTGVAVQGRALNAAAADPATFARIKEETNWPTPPVQAEITTMRDAAVRWTGLGTLALVVGVGATLVLRRRTRRLTIRYVGGPQVRSEIGPTLLEVSRANGIPHMSVCGGRGRCSTCRVLVMHDDACLTAPEKVELDTLAAIKAGPNVRLACQARPRADATVMPLLRVGAAADRRARLARQLAPEGHAGVEQDLAVLFVDMRGFTALTQRKLAFDVVFILNQFFAAVGQPVEEHGGWIHNYAGDGMIAVFADPAGLAGACRAALRAAADIDTAMSALNAQMAGELQTALRIAMGLHAGSHVVGRVGYGESPAPSVIGLAINVASRLEAIAKTAGAQIALSETVADHAGLDVRGLHRETQAVRGLEQPIGVVFMDQARAIKRRLPVPVAA